MQIQPAARRFAEVTRGRRNLLGPPLLPKVIVVLRLHSPAIVAWLWRGEDAQCACHLAEMEKSGLALVW